MLSYFVNINFFYKIDVVRSFIIIAQHRKPSSSLTLKPLTLITHTQKLSHSHLQRLGALKLHRRRHCNLSRRCNITISVTLTMLQPHCHSHNAITSLLVTKGQLSFSFFVSFYFVLLLTLPFEVFLPFSVSQDSNHFHSPHPLCQSHRMQYK